MRKEVSMNRTHTNGELRLSDVNKKVTLLGWVAKRRNFGSLVFIDLRDLSGITQLVLMKKAVKQSKRYAMSISSR